MALRDLGYRPYDGARLPASHNTWVLLRHGIRRAWASWLVKIAAFFCWVPAFIAIVGIAIKVSIAQNSPIPAERLDEIIDAPEIVRYVLLAQLWMFVTMVTLGAGSSAIAEDLTFKAFQFYFAKPVTQAQYLAARVCAVGLFCFLFTFVPAFLVVMALAGTSPPELRLERAGLVLPALIASLATSVVGSTASVAMSALSKSRALTMSSWVLFFIVPWVLAGLVNLLAEWPWAGLASLPELLGVIYDALFRVESESPLRWYHASGVLAITSLASILYAHSRLVRAEVIA